MTGYRHPCKYCGELVPPDAGACPACGKVNPYGDFRCPKCSKPCGEGKFCGNCGAPLEMPKCSCGATNQPGTNFCGGCGRKL